MKNFFLGFSIFFKGIGVSFSHTKIRKIIIASSFINFLIFLSLVGFLGEKLTGYLKSKLSPPVIWYEHFSYLFSFALGYVAVFIVSVILVYLVASILMVGWGDSLARYALLSKNLDIRKSLWSESVKKIPGALLKALILIVVSTAGFILALVPGLGIIGLLINSTAVAFDMMDYSFDHLGLTLQERFSFLTSNLLAILGFALGLGFLMSIPVVNVLLLPSCVVAASILVAEIRRVP